MPPSSFQTILSDFAAPNHCGLAPVIADHYKLRHIRTSQHGIQVVLLFPFHLFRRPPSFQFSLTYSSGQFRHSSKARHTSWTFTFCSASIIFYLLTRHKFSNLFTCTAGANRLAFIFNDETNPSQQPFWPARGGRIHTQAWPLPGPLCPS